MFLDRCIKNIRTEALKPENNCLSVYEAILHGARGPPPPLAPPPPPPPPQPPSQIQVGAPRYCNPYGQRESVSQSVIREGVSHHHRHLKVGFIPKELCCHRNS